MFLLSFLMSVVVGFVIACMIVSVGFAIATLIHGHILQSRLKTLDANVARSLDRNFINKMEAFRNELS